MFKPHQHRSVLSKILMGVGAVIAVIAITALLALAFMLLWNALMPSQFGLKPLDYFPALGLLVLARVLFGFPHKGHHHSPRGRKKFPDPKAWMDSDCGDSGSWGQWEKWKNYREFWNDEGREAFEEFLLKKKTAPEANPTKDETPAADDKKI